MTELTVSKLHSRKLNNQKYATIVDPDQHNEWAESVEPDQQVHPADNSMFVYK